MLPKTAQKEKSHIEFFFVGIYSSREWLKSRKEEDEALSSVWWKQSGICLMRNYVPEAAEIKIKTGRGGTHPYAAGS